MKIFERRSSQLGRDRRIITFLGVIPFFAVGAVVVSYSADSVILKFVLLPLAAVVTIFQAVVSLWSIVARWDESYAYAVAAVKIHARLTADFETLATAPLKKLEDEIQRLRFEYTRQESED